MKKNVKLSVGDLVEVNITDKPYRATIIDIIEWIESEPEHVKINHKHVDLSIVNEENFIQVLMILAKPWTSPNGEVIDEVIVTPRDFELGWCCITNTNRSKGQVS